jgi:hypothetical protein
MLERIEIDGNKYYKRTLEVLSGVKEFYDVDDNILLIAQAIDNPNTFPFILEDIYDMDFDEDIRLALARIQIDSKLHMHDDLEREQKRLFVSETIENMLFGDLLLDGNGRGREKDEDDDKKKEKGKSKSKGQNKGGEKGKGTTKGGGKSKGKGKRKGKNKKTVDEPDKDRDHTYV